MLFKILILCCGFLLVTSQRRREGKFFSFNFEDSDITVDLDFSIPFITIPVKKTSEAFGLAFPTLNINPASLVLGSAVVLGTTVALPFIMKHYAATSNQNYRLSRILDTTEFGADGVIHYASKVLENGGGLRGCTLKVACLTAQRRDEYLTRVVSRITSNQLMSTFINQTAVEDAMLSGRSGRDCTSYKPCPFQENNIPILLHNLSVLGKSYGL